MIYQEPLNEGRLAYYMVLEPGTPAVAVSINNNAWTSNNQGWTVVGNNVRPTQSPGFSIDGLSIGGGALLVTDNDQIEPISSNQVGLASSVSAGGSATTFETTGVVVRLIEENGNGSDPNLVSASALPTSITDVDYSIRSSIEGSGNIASLDSNGQGYSIGFAIDPESVVFREVDAPIPPDEPYSPPERAVVAIDFENSTQLSLATALSPFDSNEYVYVRDEGEISEAFIRDATALVDEVQSIFDRSNVGIEVIDASELQGDVDSLVTVVFHPTDTPGQLGNAYDIRSSDFEGIGYAISGGDRFDLGSGLILSAIALAALVIYWL